MRRLLAIGNDDAGSATDQVLNDVLAALGEWAVVTLERTSSLNELKQVLQDNPDVDLVAVLGGDGSLHAVVDALHALDRLAGTPVLLIPLGTGNDFARTLDLPEEPVAAASSAHAWTVLPIDLIEDASGRIVVNAAHVGVGAEAAATASPWKARFGPVGYAIGALTSGLTRPGARVTVTVDGRALPARGPVAQVAVGNGRFVGAGAPLLPEADPSDGLMDVAVSYSSSVFRRLAYGWNVRRGLHQHLADVAYLRGSEVTVIGEPLRCTSDGELTDPSPDHAWRILPGALQMVLPASE